MGLHSLTHVGKHSCPWLFLLKEGEQHWYLSWECMIVNIKHIQTATFPRRTYIIHFQQSECLLGGLILLEHVHGFLTYRLQFLELSNVRVGERIVCMPWQLIALSWDGHEMAKFVVSKYFSFAFSLSNIHLSCCFRVTSQPIGYPRSLIRTWGSKSLLAKVWHANLDSLGVSILISQN